jgi:DNA primase
MRVVINGQGKGLHLTPLDKRLSGSSRLHEVAGYVCHGMAGANPHGCVARRRCKELLQERQGSLV